MTVVEVPCEDDGVYNVGVSIRAVNLNENKQALWGPPSDRQSVAVCREPGMYTLHAFTNQRES